MDHSSNPSKMTDKSPTDEEFTPEISSSEEDSEDDCDSADTDYYLQEVSNPTFRDRVVASLRAIEREQEGLQYKKEFKQELLGSIPESSDATTISTLLEELKQNDLYEVIVSSFVSSFLTVETAAHNVYTFEEWLEEVGEVVEVDEETVEVHKKLNLKLEKVNKMIKEINELTEKWCEKVRSDLEMNTMLDSDFVKIQQTDYEESDDEE